MSEISSSYRVQYDLRPCKQVERRMLVDALQRLGAAGFPNILNTSTLGLAQSTLSISSCSTNLLGLRSFLSLERETALKKRVEFNRPFACVDIRDRYGRPAEMPSLSRDARHLLWLDYDGVMHRDFLSDIQSAVTVLPTGSILLVTVDVEPPEAYDYKDVDPSFDDTKRCSDRNIGRHISNITPPTI